MEYYIDRFSIYIDPDGDAYGDTYDEHFRRIGNIKLSHFKNKF